jgi:ABC-type glycerol-3-phosphate transport system substrate-binding protein
VAATIGARARSARAQAKPNKLVYVGDNGPWHWCLVQEVAPAFEKATGIKIDFTLLPGDAETVRLKSELSAGSGAIDVVQWNPNMAGWIARHMQDHQKLLAAAASRQPDFDWADFLPAAQAMATYDGKLAGIPYRVVTDILHYQKPVLQQAGIAKPPETFAEFQAVAQATTKLGLPHRYGVGFIARQGTAILDPFTPILRSTGGDFYNPKTGEIFINRPPAIEALEFYGDLMTKYHVMNPDSIT